MSISLEEIKIYLKVDGDEENTLITSMIITAEEMCEVILRYPIKELKELPETIKQAVYYAVANMYEEREKTNIKDVFEVKKRLLFSYRKESW